MYILLIIWFLFLFAYIIFNVYGLSRVMAMRIKGDRTPLAILIFLIAVFAVISISLLIISRLNWGQSIGSFFRF